LAQDKNITLSQLVLRWTTLQQGITIVLAGARNAQQATENAHSISVSISPREMEFIHQALSEI